MRTILLAGGGTLGPVTPLLAAASRMREMRHGLRFVWAGTDRGPEKEVVERAGIPFHVIPTAKLPRHLSWKLLTAPLDYVRARSEASRFLNQVRPALVLSAGGFTAVPVTLEAAGRGLPCIAHQLDYTPGLSNRLAAKYCRYVSTSFEYSTPPFGTRVVTYRVPTPARYALKDLASHTTACNFFGFDPMRPVILVMGGGTGAKTLNEVMNAMHEWFGTHAQVLHLTGNGKSSGMEGRRWKRPAHHHVGAHMPMGHFEAPTMGSPYVIAEFLGDEMPLAYAAADIVVSRAGVGAIAELAALKKPTILVPLPNSPQEANAKALGDAVQVVEQGRDFSDHLLWSIEHLIDDLEERKRLGSALHDAFPTDQGEALASLALSVLV